MKNLRSKLGITCLLALVFIHPAYGQNRRKQMEQPPKIPGVDYRFCQPLTDQQKLQRAKHGSPGRSISKSEGETRYDQKWGAWTFWDDAGKKMAQGSCLAKPALKETTEHGTWTYWDPSGRKIDMDWKYGSYDGIWTMYDPSGKKVWQYKVKSGEPKVETFIDKDYVKSQNLKKDIPAR